MEVMTWQEKLRILIEAHKLGHPILKHEFYYTTPVDAKLVDTILQEVAQQYELDTRVLRPLSNLYEVTDGVNISGSFRIAGLVSREFEALRDFNSTFLQLVQQMSQDTSFGNLFVKLIFGSDEAGDFFCISQSGLVVRVGHDAPETKVVTDSLDAFFNDVCMGPGFIRYYQPKSDDKWTIILREFGFI